jgi:hypothetical protein
VRHQLTVFAAVIATATAVVLLAYLAELNQGFWPAILAVVVIGGSLGFMAITRAVDRYQHVQAALDADHEVVDVVRGPGLTIHIPRPVTCAICGQPVWLAPRPIFRRGGG